MTTDTAAGRPPRHFHVNMQALGIFGAAAFIFVIITGGIDLSVGSIASFVGIVSANLMVNAGVGAFPA
jgi:ribose/xylose/arabinose/galactoside ABC-type transport system permease subunit